MLLSGIQMSVVSVKSWFVSLLLVLTQRLKERNNVLIDFTKYLTFSSKILRNTHILKILSTDTIIDNKTVGLNELLDDYHHNVLKI